MERTDRRIASVSFERAGSLFTSSTETDFTHDVRMDRNVGFLFSFVFLNVGARASLRNLESRSAKLISSHESNGDWGVPRNENSASALRGKRDYLPRESSPASGFTKSQRSSWIFKECEDSAARPRLRCTNSRQTYPTTRSLVVIKLAIVTVPWRLFMRSFFARQCLVHVRTAFFPLPYQARASCVNNCSFNL